MSIVCFLLPLFSQTVTMKKQLLFFLLLTGLSFSAHATYCPYSFTDPSSQYQHCITNVKIGTNSNYSGPLQTPFPHSITYGFLGSYNFGQSYPIEIGVSPSTRYRYISIYLDYNHDGDYGAFEYIASGLVQPGDTLFSDNFSVWTIGFTGNTGLRVILADDSSFAQTPLPILLDACSSQYMWGEVEDYTVATQSATGIPTLSANDIRLYPIPGNKFLALDSQDKIDHVKIYDTAGKLQKGILYDLNEKKVYIEHLPEGSYLIELYQNEKVITKKFMVMH